MTSLDTAPLCNFIAASSLCFVSCDIPRANIAPPIVAWLFKKRKSGHIVSIQISQSGWHFYVLYSKKSVSLAVVTYTFCFCFLYLHKYSTKANHLAIFKFKSMHQQNPFPYKRHLSISLFPNQVVMFQTILYFLIHEFTKAILHN